MRLWKTLSVGLVCKYFNQPCRQQGRDYSVGGDQKRPNLHINDMCDVYSMMLKAPAEKIQGETFNIGYQNHTIKEIAGFVKKVVQEEFPEKGEIEIKFTESDDNRSYHINSDKIYKVLGYRPKRSIEDAVRSLCEAFSDNRLPDSFENSEYYNVRTMKELGAK